MLPIEIIMFTGLSGAGKSSIAGQLEVAVHELGYNVRLVCFDELRKTLAWPLDPNSPDAGVRQEIYSKAIVLFRAWVAQGQFLIVDNGLASESLRWMLKNELPSLRLVHIDCPKWLAAWRETVRSMSGRPHQRGRFLYFRALVLNHFTKNWTYLPGVNYAYDSPKLSADFSVGSGLSTPGESARKIVEGLCLKKQRKMSGSLVGEVIDAKS